MSRWDNDNCQTGVALPMYIYVIPRPNVGPRFLDGTMTTASPELPYPCTFMLFPGQVYSQDFSVGYERISKQAFS